MDTSLQPLSETRIESSMTSTEEIRQDISAHRAAIVETINELDERFQEVTDWRTYIAAHPYVAIGVAAGTGILAARLLRSKASPQERMMNALADSVEHFCVEARSGFDAVVGRVTPRQTSALQTILLGFAAKAAKDYLLGKIERPILPVITRNQRRT